MGLDIYFKGTKKLISWNYLSLHYAIRQAALFACGMPKTLGVDDDGTVDSFVFYLYPYAWRKHIKVEELQKLFWAVQQAGYFFPNIMFHSDDDGNYTKRGKVFKKPSLKSGNSKELLKELELIIQGEAYLKLNEKWQKLFMLFYEYVKDEVLNGIGRIIFS